MDQEFAKKWAERHPKGAANSMQYSLLARSIHQGPTAAHDALHSAAFSAIEVLDVPSCTPPRLSGRKRHCAQHLEALVTNPGEYFGLALRAGDLLREAENRAEHHGQKSRAHHPELGRQ